jgi:hypothetical protein
VHVFFKSQYSAAVRAIRGKVILSTTGSLAKLIYKTDRSIAPVCLNSFTKYSASSKVMPMAPKTTANCEPSSSLALGLAGYLGGHFGVRKS